MNPVLMAALISGGINALQGKRGSDLLKSTVKDAAMAYAFSKVPGVEVAGADKGISNLASQGGKELATAPSKTALMKGAVQPELYKSAVAPTTSKNLTMGQKLDKAFTAIEKPFRDPSDPKKLSRFRLGLGAAGLGGTAYAAGLFDPKDAPDPKYPGFNKFYASDQKMFQPLSGQYGPDYTKYPEGSPYSGMQEGGIADAAMMSPDDEMLQFDMQQQSMADGPGIVANLMKRFEESISDPEKMAMKASMKRPVRSVGKVPEPTILNAVPLSEDTVTIPKRIEKDFIMKFKEDPDKTAVEFATMMRDKDRITIADVQKAKDMLEQMTKSSEMPPLGDIEGIIGLTQSPGQVRIPTAPDAPAAIQELMETVRSRSANEPRMQEFNKGDIVDVLPSKLKRDENDTSNYKRTSGKMVVDETGKGSGNKDTMLAQLADGEFVTKAKSVLGAGKAMGGKNKKEQRELGARFFYKQMSDLEKLAESA